jgi:hypothetical protein
MVECMENWHKGKKTFRGYRDHRMPKIPWTAQMSNETVLIEVKLKRKLLN